MIIQESPDQSTQLALTLSKALTQNKLDTMLSLIHPKMPKKQQKDLMRAVKEGRTIAFDIIEMMGKIKVPRYECIIDFTKNEVHVILKNNEHEYGVHNFKVIE